MKLIIGNKTYSSWSLRPWVLMKHFNIPFEEILVKLDMPETKAEIAKYSPSGKVPALIDGDLSIWESAAIMEYLNEKYPEKKMYPTDLKQRALARSLSMEMHAGFGKMRERLSFNVKKSYQNFDFGSAQSDIDRVKVLWTEQLKVSKGPFLFGEFSIADAMYAPVVGRFVTYGVPVDGLVKNYCEAIMNLPALKEWYAGAMKEDFEAKDHI
ncbi:glutathione S-transferase family protein [Peredibacter starrii]|uniref:Glutathione S-transferase family protein n=1 Tax=Peredibacter starrii TaxID=28202 RepID=A0AAX4HPY2_9BACT|nr:glutathione S-transferase family protein [Peredibacter starrii]WPU65187.1 glutathione S-transferase family protein [Peredibacter starrii]